eukprot:m.140348 g.140348  ORF g.140348 m.140348 type:complete len:1261 (+) comp17082_c0_seq3:824-4606(+)
MFSATGTAPSRWTTTDPSHAQATHTAAPTPRWSALEHHTNDQRPGPCVYYSDRSPEVHKQQNHKHPLAKMKWAVVVVVAAAVAEVVAAVANDAPVLPISLAPAGSWPKYQKGMSHGDIRAVVRVTAVPADGMTEAQVWWRRRDDNPELKAVLVTTASGQAVKLASADIETACGVITFDSSQYGAGDYHVYYLPFNQGGGGAHLHFSWYNCSATAHPRECVLSARVADVCGSVSASAAAVVGLEARPGPAGSDSVAFHALSEMELAATTSEVQAATATASAMHLPFAVFPETREHPARMFNLLSARWARKGPSTTFAATAALGEYYAFQVGIFAAFGPVTHVTTEWSDLHSGAHTIPASACRTLNLGGVDQHGVEFNRSYAVSNQHVGVLWLAVELPADASAAAGVFNGTVTILSDQGRVTVDLSLNVVVPSNGKPIPNQGFDNLYNFTRLAWLNSKRGVDDTIPHPFAAVVVNKQSSSATAFSLELVNKRLDIGHDGFLAQATVSTKKIRKGKNVTKTYEVLQAATSFELVDGTGAPIQLAITKPAAVTSATSNLVTWSATLAGGGVQAVIQASLGFDSYLEYSVSLSAIDTPVHLANTSLVLAAKEPRYMVGFGTLGSFYHDLDWHWKFDNETLCCGDNRAWMGRMEAGVFWTLKGPGNDWNDPMFSKDAAFIPFIPHSWGGVNATNGQYGGTIRNGTMRTQSGPRTLTPGKPVTFLFDMAVTPSKPQDFRAHFSKRYIQVGYGTPYYSPQQAKALNATVVTLHQGIPGVINGTLVNPYIDYPFVPQTVELMENYTRQSRELGMAVKFYYTIRELSNHAAELFALLALQGEVITDVDPYSIPQRGYCHDWDCHGGCAWLHQHVVHNYTACWQQSLSDGEWDCAVCDIGTSQWFNYYVEGLYHSVSQAPHMNGVYYDGINFDRRSMIRVRKSLDLATEHAETNMPGLIDIHTGYNHNSPPSVSYLSHFAFANRAWNGEGFNWHSSGPAYWLVDVSAFLHGIFADRLGGTGAATDFKGMLFASYQRNTDASRALWTLWDEVQIQDTTLIGWWEDDSPVSLTISNHSDANTTCNSSMHHYTNSYPEACGGSSGDIGFGGGCGPGLKPQYPPMTVEEAINTCCQLGSECAGLSIAHDTDAQHRADGCFKKNVDCGVATNPRFDGYAKPQASSCSANASAPSAVLSAVYVEYSKRALVVVASWCAKTAAVTAVVDWDALGLSPSTAKVYAPDIPGVQANVTVRSDFKLTIAPQSGVIFVIEAEA